MTLLGRILLALCLICAIAAIWTGYPWQYGLTALVLFVTGGAILGRSAA